MTSHLHSSAPLLSVENLAVTIGGVHAVRGISFAMQSGEIVGLVGESGSGKSVACRSIAGLLPPHASTSGSIVFDGHDLTSLSAAEMRAVRGQQISMIFQNPASHLDPLMRIGRQIAEPLRIHFGYGAGQSRTEAAAILRDVQMHDPEQRVDSYPHELSGGMKQRAMIAAGIACSPRLLLADEPTTALDVTVQARILKLLKDLNERRGLSIVLVSHDLGVVAEICDRVVVMQNGVVVEAGSSRDIIDAPQHEYTRRLINSQPARLASGSLRKDRAGHERDHVATPLLEISDLTVRYGGTKPILKPFTRTGGVLAVNDASFEVSQGEALGIVGESGSGKSTMAQVIMKLVDPSAGDIRFDGRSILPLKGASLSRYRRAVQMIFQNPFDSLNPRMTVEQTVIEPIVQHRLAPRKEAREQAMELLELVELPLALARRQPRQLSGGQCQRVGIARALALDPEVLIADEITSALDVTIQAQILALLRDLRQKKNLTIIYISHDLSVVRAFCDRVAVFQSGQRVEIGTVNDVFFKPEKDYTKTLLSSAPRLNAAETDAATYRESRTGG